MKVIQKLVICALYIGLLSGTAYAQSAPIDSATAEICNQIIQSVFSEVEKRKSKYDDLKLFNVIALKTNEWDMKYIKYRYLDVVGSKKVDELEFGVEFLPIDADKEYSFEGTHFEYSFPILKVKLIAYQNDSIKNRQIDIIPFVKEHARQLLDYQSQFMPVKLMLSSDKEVYQIDEPITFVAELENLTYNNIYVKDLSGKSIALIYDDVTWGVDLNRSHPKDGKEVLRPGKTLKRKFRLTGFNEPQDLSIHATYLMNFKGATPTNTLHLKVAE